MGKNTLTIIRRALNIAMSLFLLVGLFSISGVAVKAAETVISDGATYYPGDVISAGEGKTVELKMNDNDTHVKIGDNVVATLASGENQPYHDTENNKYCFDVIVGEDTHVIKFDANDKGKPVAIKASLSDEVYRFSPVYSSDSGTTAVESVSVTPKEVTITLGAADSQAQLTATVSPEGTTAEIVWTSGDEQVATVTDSGVVTGLKAGSATITATAGDKSDTCIVNVAENAPISAPHTITIGDVTGDGTVAVEDGKTQESAPNLVKLIVTPEEGGKLESLIVSADSGQSVTVSDNSFTMPASNVTVSAVFVRDSTPVSDKPVPSNVHWYNGDNYYLVHYGIWEEPEDETGCITGYEATVYSEDRSKSLTISGADIRNVEPGVKGADFSDFIEENGSGTYLFEVKTKYYDTTSSPGFTSDSCSFVTLSISMKTVDKDGSALDEQGGNVWAENKTYGSGETVNTKVQYLLPSSPLNEYELVAQPDTRYKVKEVKLNGTDVEVSQDRKTTVSAVISDDTTLDVVFEKDEEDVSVIVDACTGHSELAAELAAVFDGQYDVSYTPGETNITITDWPGASSKHDVIFKLSLLMDDYLQPSPLSPVVDNNEVLYTSSGGLGLHELDYYADDEAISEENSRSVNTPVNNNDVYYLHWVKPVTEGSFTITPPKCGTTITAITVQDPITGEEILIRQDPLPVITAETGSSMVIEEGYSIPVNYWVESDGKTGFSGTIKGGESYSARFMLSTKFGYYINPDSVDNLNVLVNGEKAEVKIAEETYSSPAYVYVVATVEAEHDWEEPTYTWAEDDSTCTGTVECKHFDTCGGAKTETVQSQQIVPVPPTETKPGVIVIVAELHEPFDPQIKFNELSPLSKKYTAVKGIGGVYTKGSNTSLVFEIKANQDDPETINLFKWIAVDKKTVDKTKYSTSPGSVVIDLKPEYLEKLPVGGHTLSVYFKDSLDPVDIPFTVKEKASGGSPSKKPAAPVDNVVTCQMAGYPSNYSWNEAAKACQPGYLDAGGNFHPYRTPSRIIPNTSDRDIMIHAWIAMLSITIGLFCGVKLLHEDWEV